MQCIFAAGKNSCFFHFAEKRFYVLCRQSFPGSSPAAHTIDVAVKCATALLVVLLVGASQTQRPPGSKRDTRHCSEKIKQQNGSEGPSKELPQQQLDKKCFFCSGAGHTDKWSQAGGGAAVGLASHLESRCAKR